MALNGLLRNVAPAQYCLLSTAGSVAAPSGSQTPACEPLPANLHHLQVGNYQASKQRGVARLWRNVSGAACETWRRAQAIGRVLQMEGCQAIVACSAELVDIPAAWLAARRLGLANVVVMFDDYTSQWTGQFARRWASANWRLIARGADAVIVTNATLAEDYRRRYGIDCVVIPNPISGPIPLSPVDGRAILEPGQELRIVYTGAVYDAHYDAFRNLVAALGQAGLPACRLHIYTACDPALLAAQGITGPVVFHPHLEHAAARRLQQEADLLFLPLAFQSPYPEIVRTATPMKMGEYLASGRPILAHAPADSHLSRYFRLHNCGALVDQNDPTMLAEQLRGLLASPARQATIVHNALERARVDFAPEQAQERFLKAVEDAARSRLGQWQVRGAA